MALETFDIVAATASALILAVGYLIGIYLVGVYKKTKKPIILLSSILFFTLPSPWLTDVLVILIVLFDGSVPAGFGLYVSAWSIPILVSTWLYITGSLYRDRPWFKYFTLSIGVIPGIVYYIYVYVIKAWKEKPIPDSHLTNVEYELIPFAIILIYGIAGISIVFTSYAIFAYKSQNKLFKFRSSMIAIGSLLFTIAGVTDSFLVYDQLFHFIVIRFLVLLSMISLFLGYNTPTRIREKFA